MAIGDDAVDAGYPLVPNVGEEGKVRWGAREINRTRDYVAQVKALVLSTWPVSRGGTGATSAAQARINLGVAAASHKHSASDITSGTLSLSRGGTGATNKGGVRTNIGITSSSTMIANSSGADGDIFFKIV